MFFILRFAPIPSKTWKGLFEIQRRNAKRLKIYLHVQYSRFAEGKDLILNVQKNIWIQNVIYFRIDFDWYSSVLYFSDFVKTCDTLKKRTLTVVWLHQVSLIEKYNVGNRIPLFETIRRYYLHFKNQEIFMVIVNFSFRNLSIHLLKDLIIWFSNRPVNIGRYIVWCLHFKPR